jgi:hypothetical protein
MRDDAGKKMRYNQDELRLQLLKNQKSSQNQKQSNSQSRVVLENCDRIYA